MALAAGACSPSAEDALDATILPPEQTGEDSPSLETGDRPAPLGELPSVLDLVGAPPPPFCGDGRLNDDEACDDGLTEAGDGCSANCLVVEQGYTCDTAGSACTPAELCGDALQVGAELCDDGNAADNDGCTSGCLVEKDFVCAVPGNACLYTVECGDGVILGNETCDDGNINPDDGCSADCQTELGWTCTFAGRRCTGTCGDGLLRGAEQCDDANAAAPGCSATCSREAGFVCDTPGEPCFRAVCGNGSPEADETCDDGVNDFPFDGCFQCVAEPLCVLGACGAVCGDGRRYNSEPCDDGNLNEGDGCSSLCIVEAGWNCPASLVGADANTFTLPVIYRDFIGADTSGDGLEGQRATARAANQVLQHPDFNVFTGTGLLGIVNNQLGADGRPVLTCALAGCTDNPAFSNATRNVSSQASFNQWYRNTARVNLPIVRTLTLARQANGSFLFDSAPGQFDPLAAAGWNAPQSVGGGVSTVFEGREFCNGDQLTGPTGAGAVARNMSFTTETRFVFEYQGGESFAFSGDDDVWVFVNNRLVVDLGGLHERATGAFTLSAAPGTQGVAAVTQVGPPAGGPLGLTRDVNTAMVLGDVYEVSMFHAERHECGSNFKLTLSGFNKPKSACTEVCGDGIVTPSEICDDGENNGAGYDFCDIGCVPGPRCGDAVVNGPEACDNGKNLDGYLTSTTACAAGCQVPARCGDGFLDARYGEQCDDGTNAGAYDGCNPDCKLGPRCGDGSVNGDEECDDGNRVNSDGCDVRCKLERVVIPG